MEDRIVKKVNGKTKVLYHIQIEPEIISTDTYDFFIYSGEDGVDEQDVINGFANDYGEPETETVHLVLENYWACTVYVSSTNTPPTKEELEGEIMVDAIMQGDFD